jgi:hypothetical protein
MMVLGVLLKLTSRVLHGALCLMRRSLFTATPALVEIVKQYMGTNF